MEFIKANAYLSTFSKAEIIEFNKFINSPYFNKSKKIIKLFNYIKKYHPEFKSRALEKDKLYFKVFGSRKYNTGTLNNLFTKLIKLIDDYMTLTQILTNDMNYHINLLTQLRKRKLISGLNTKYKKWIVKPDPKFLNDPDYFLNNYKLKKFSVHNSYFRTPTLKTESIIKNLSDAYAELLNFFYLHSFRDYFRLKIIMSSIKFDLNKYGSLSILENVIKNSTAIPDNPALNIYKLFLGIFDPLIKPDYFILKESLLNLKNKISDRDFNFLLVLLYQYGYSLADDQNKTLGKEVFNLLKFIFSRKIWAKDSESLNELIYYSVVKTAIRVNYYEWAENFVNSYLSKIDDERRFDIKNLCTAEICFSKAQNSDNGNYDLYNKALEYLAKFKSQEFFSKCRIFNLVIMIYYETDELEYLYYQCDSYQHYLKDHMQQILDDDFKSNLNFTRFCNDLAKMKQNVNKQSLKDLQKTIKKEPLCTNYHWIVKKAEDLVKISKF